MIVNFYELFEFLFSSQDVPEGLLEELLNKVIKQEVKQKLEGELK